MKNCHEKLGHLAIEDKASCMLYAARVHTNKDKGAS